MVKLIALITMLIDHIGVAFLDNLGSVRLFFRFIGRFSMPLFAYCIARSFNHYSENGNIKKYFKNLAIFAVVSQYPFWFFYKFCVEHETNFNVLNLLDVLKYLNIGFTWFVSLLFLWLFNRLTLEFNKKNLLYLFLILSLFLFSIFVKFDYGLYGVLFTVGFYFFYFKFNSSILLLLFSFFNCIVYCLEFENCFFCFDYQIIFGVFGVFLAIYLQKSNLNFRLPKGVFYFFYPLHFGIMACIKYGYLCNLF